MNCHVLSQQLNCFRLKFCSCCLWIWKSSTRLVTSGYAVLMIQATLPLRHYTAHLLHWPCKPGQKTSEYDQELSQTQPTDSTVMNLYNQRTMLLKNFKMNNYCMTFFDIWNKLFKPFWIYFAWRLSSIFSSRGHIVWKMFFEEFYDGCLMLSPLWHLNGMILA